MFPEASSWFPAAAISCSGTIGIVLSTVVTLAYSPRGTSLELRCLSIVQWRRPPENFRGLVSQPSERSGSSEGSTNHVDPARGVMAARGRGQPGPQPRNQHTTPQN